MTEVAERQASFDEQYSNHQTLKNEVGDMRFVRVLSQNPSLEPLNDLVAIPGWSITLGTQKDFIRMLATGETTVQARNPEINEPIYKTYYGRNVTACEFPRFGGEAAKNEDMGEQVVRQAELVAQLISETAGDKKVDIAGQSMAAMDIMAACKLHPELLSKIGKIVITSAAGISGGDDFFKLLGRFAIHLNQDTITTIKSPIERRNLIKTGINTTLYSLKNLPRTIGEAKEIADSDEYEGLKELKKEFENNGIKLTFIQGEEDKLTPADKMWKRASEGDDSYEESLVIGDNDSPDEIREKGTKILENKKRVMDNLRESGNLPPIDALRLIGGGHDNRIYGEKEFGLKVLQSLE